MKCQDKSINRISANQIAAIITAFKRQRAIIARRVLFCVDKGRIRRCISKIFCTLESQIFAMLKSSIFGCFIINRQQGYMLPN